MLRSQTYWAGMVRNSPTLLTDIIAIFMEESNEVKDAAGITPSIAIQGVPLNMIARFSKNGGNALGITTADGPLVREYPQIASPLHETQN